MLNIFLSYNANYMQTHYNQIYDTICMSDISLLQGAVYLNID